MRILFLSIDGAYPFRIGGSFVASYNLVRELSRRGVDIDFVFGVSAEEMKRSGDFSSAFGFPPNVSLVPVTADEGLSGSRIVPFDFQFMQDLFMIGRQASRQFDLAFFNDFPSARGALAPLLCRLRGVPTVLRVGGWVNYERLVEREGGGCFLRGYDYLSLMLVRHVYVRVVCNSSDLRRRLIQSGFFNEQKMEVVPNGVDTARFREAERTELKGEPCLLYVGRLEHIKGVDVLVRSMKPVTKQLPSAVLHVVGDGSMMNALKSYVRSHGLEGNVVFHGKVIEELPSFYKSVDICVVPSRYEAFGTVILEAMSAGKPIVASGRGGIPELVKPFVNGVLVEPDEAELSKALVALWKDNSLMGEMGRRNSEKTRDFEWGKTAEQYLNVFKDVLGLKS